MKSQAFLSSQAQSLFYPSCIDIDSKALVTVSQFMAAHGV